MASRSSGRAGSLGAAGFDARAARAGAARRCARRSSQRRGACRAPSTASRSSSPPRSTSSTRRARTRPSGRSRPPASCARRPARSGRTSRTYRASRGAGPRQPPPPATRGVRPSSPSSPVLSTSKSRAARAGASGKGRPPRRVASTAWAVVDGVGVHPRLRPEGGHEHGAVARPRPGRGRRQRRGRRRPRRAAREVEPERRSKAAPRARLRHVEPRSPPEQRRRRRDGLAHELAEPRAPARPVLDGEQGADHRLARDGQDGGLRLEQVDPGVPLGVARGLVREGPRDDGVRVLRERAEVRLERAVVDGAFPGACPEDAQRTTTASAASRPDLQTRRATGPGRRRAMAAPRRRPRPPPRTALDEPARPSSSCRRGATPTDPPEVLARVREGLDLVDLLARQMRRQIGASVQVDDLASAGREALVLAARGFDASRGVPFRRWANLRVRGAMIDAARSTGLPRRPREACAQEPTASKGDGGGRGAAPSNAESRRASPPGRGRRSRVVAHMAQLETARDAKESPRTGRPRGARRRARPSTPARTTSGRCSSATTEDVTFEEAAREIGLEVWASRLHAPSRPWRDLATRRRALATWPQPRRAADRVHASSRALSSRLAPRRPSAVRGRRLPGRRARPPPAADGPPGGPSARRSAPQRRADDSERAARAPSAASGRDLAPGELLLLQARLYRYGEAVDLTSKLVDRATNAARTVLQAQ